MLRNPNSMTGGKKISVMAAALGIAALTAIGLAPIAANAADVPDAITSVTILAPNPATPNAPLRVGQTFQVSATWAVPNGSAPGDTFQLNFPTPITGFVANLNLLDSSGDVVGTCAVTAGDFICTLTNFVATHTDVHGVLTFNAVAGGAVSGVINFISTGGRAVPAAIPGGGIVIPGNTGVSDPVKVGTQQPDGNIQWEVLIPANNLVDGTVLTDTFSPSLTLVIPTFKIVEGPQSALVNGSFGGAGTVVAQGTTANTYSFVNSPSTASFVVTMHQPITDPADAYALIYSTMPPAQTPNGTVFSNSIVGTGGINASASVNFLTATGNASGTLVVPAAPVALGAPLNPAIHLPLVSG